MHASRGKEPGTDMAQSPGRATTDRLREAVAHHQAGRLDKAEAIYRAVLDDQPNQPDALHLLGVVRHQAGAYGDAIGLIERAIAGNGLQPAYRNNLGEVLAAEGRWSDALACYRAAIGLNPAYIQAALNIAKALHRLGRTDEALDQVRGVISDHPDNPMGHVNLATLLIESGDLPAAVAALRRAVEIDPGLANAHFNLGKALEGLGDRQAAAQAYRQAIEAQPEFIAAIINLANIMHEDGALDEAVRLYRQALRIEPTSAVARSNLGRALQAQGAFDDAVACYRRAIADDPTLAAAHANLGNALSDLGKITESIAAHRRALELDPALAEPWWHLSVIKRFKSDADEDLAAMERRAASAPDLTDAQRMYLGFALAKAYDDLGRYADAFRHLEEANRLKRATIEFDMDAHDRFCDRMTAAFPVGAAAPADAGSESELPIFVLGMPRSGTSLVEQILASHPDVHGAGELAALRDAIEATCGGTDIPETLAGLDGPAWREIGEAYVATIRSLDPTARRITDKMPGNYRFIGAIGRALPRARIVHCRREPVATCLSCYRTLFSGRQDFAYDLSELGRHYVLYDRLMNHWHKVLPGRVHDIDYASLVADPAGETRRLLDFCGLAWDDGCLDFHRTDRAVRTASTVQVRKPVYTSSVDHWRHYATELQPLITALGDLAPGGEPPTR